MVAFGARQWRRIGAVTVAAIVLAAPLSAAAVGLGTITQQSALGQSLRVVVPVTLGDNEEVPFAGLLQPRVEAEVGLVLGDDLDVGSHTVADVISATAYALAVLEIVDGRVAGWDISFADTVADNASGSRFVLGTVPVSLDRDLAAVTMALSLNGEVRSTGSGAACLGNPLFAARWLADTMSRLGTPLRAGDVVLTGALGKMVDVVAGDVVDATIDGIGRVGVRFAGRTAT
jgi:2-keto-4-pentenoate hydratase